MRSFLAKAFAVSLALCVSLASVPTRAYCEDAALSPERFQEITAEHLSQLDLADPGVGLDALAGKIENPSGDDLESQAGEVSARGLIAFLAAPPSTHPDEDAPLSLGFARQIGRDNLSRAKALSADWHERAKTDSALRAKLDRLRERFVPKAGGAPFDFVVIANYFNQFFDRSVRKSGFEGAVLEPAQADVEAAAESKKLKLKKSPAILPAGFDFLRSDPVLHEKLLAAADGILQLGHGDEFRGDNLHERAPGGLDLYRALGLSDAEIKKRVAARIDLLLRSNQGRHEAATIPKDAVLKALPAPQAGIAETGSFDFERKYDLALYRAYKAGAVKPLHWPDKGRYGRSLETAFVLAAEIGDTARAHQLLSTMVQTGNFEEAVKSAAQVGRDDLLLHLGLLLLTDFFTPEYNHNPLGASIEALKRIQGKLKLRADEILYDLAILISSEEFAAKAAPTAIHNPSDLAGSYALRALQSTGRLVREVEVESGSLRDEQATFLTKVENPKYAAALKTLIQRELEGPSLESEIDLMRALYALDDKKTAVDYARKRLEGGDLMITDELFEGLVQTANKAVINDLADTLLKLRKEDVTFKPSFHPHLDAARLYAAAGNLEGVLRAERLIKEDGMELPIDGYNRETGEPYSGYREMLKSYIEAAQNGFPAEATPEPKYGLEASQLRIADDLRRKAESIEYWRGRLNEAKRPGLIEKGRQLLQDGKISDAYTFFLAALDRDGLITVGDAWVKSGEAFRASDPYLFAALLSAKK